MYYSIIVPIYKVEVYLPECIESILTQTHKDFELILVDDGSPDNCPQICDDYAKKDNRIKVIHKKNGGLVSARKAGIKAALGEYVCFVDGDDFVSEDMLEAYERELCKNKADIICAGYSAYYFDGRVNAVKQNIKSGFYDKKTLLQNIYLKMLSVPPFFSFYIMPSLCTKCLKKDIIKTVYRDITENITLGEDVAVTYPAMLFSSSVSVIDYYGYMYRQNRDSMTHTYDKNLYIKMRNLLSHLKRVQDSYNWDDKNQINEYTMFLLILAKNNEFKYNYDEKYGNKKRNMKKYLADSLFRGAIKKVKLSGLRNRFILFCFKSGLLLPIALYEKIMKKRKCNE